MPCLCVGVGVCAVQCICFCVSVVVGVWCCVCASCIMRALRCNLHGDPKSRGGCCGLKMWILGPFQLRS